MKYFSKILCYLLAFHMIVGQASSLLFAQPSQRSNNPDIASPQLEPGRISGSSFGTKPKEEKQVPQILSPPVPGGGMSQFQESMTGGLTYQVHILGEVNKPGTYRITASTRLSEALQLAGGILEHGSERQIQIRRNDGRGRRVDLLSFKLFGNLDANPYLLDNDVIFVPLRDRVVEIEGAIKRPGYYELKNERTLQDVVKLAGGFTAGVGAPIPIKVIRYDHGGKELLDIENTEASRNHFAVVDADVIFIPHILTEKNIFDYNIARLPGEHQLFYPSYDERVFVLGAVDQPGPYPFSPYYNVRQYLTLAGGTTKLAKVKKIKIIQTDGKIAKPDNRTPINPGDTIVVPEKYMAPETFATLMIGITSSLVAITASVLSLTQ